MAYTIAFRGGRFKNVLLLARDPPLLHELHHPHPELEADPVPTTGSCSGTLKDLGMLDEAFRLLATPAR